VDQHRSLHVLVERLVHFELLRPFDVIANVGRVDAWAGNLQGIVHLHSFQFHDPRTGQPREHQVLCHLRLRTRRRPYRIPRRLPVKLHRKIETIIRGDVPFAPRQIEHCLLARELKSHAVDEFDEWCAKEIDHGSSGLAFVILREFLKCHSERSSTTRRIWVPSLHVFKAR
jgi:hypothetical protein